MTSNYLSDYDELRSGTGESVQEMMERHQAALRKERRERIATVIFTAYRTNPNHQLDRETAAEASARDADALIAELDKEVWK